MAEVRFAQVYKRYGAGGAGPDVITDLNLQVRDQEFLVLVGPSGCGKSTALRMVAGLEEITQGDLYIGERRVNDVAPKDRDIAMVFQNYALYPHMTVFENMAFGLRLHHITRGEIDQRVRKAARMLGIGEYLARKPRELSGGQRQRVALGRALVRDPQVFLLDEPLSNLDAKLRVQTRAEISQLHQVARTTFIYVTHDQVEAMTMGDRIAVLNAGVVQQLGTPQELYDLPANVFVASFIGSPAMNFFSGRLSTGSGADGQTAVLRLGEGDTAPRLPLSGAAAAIAARHAAAGERPIVVGIRPEDLHLADASGTDGDDAAMMAGPVDVVEHLGNEQVIYVRLPGAIQPEQAREAGEQSAPADASDSSGVLAAASASTVRLPARETARPGDQMRLRVDAAHLHFFDPATTNRLT
jgi:multiple sugar transport system ATP-binding protein